jgi:hypothetical protein
LTNPRRQFVRCIEEGSGRSPPTIRAIGTDTVINRPIDAWHIAYGTYGMGGPGFFAMRLSAIAGRPAEYRVLTLWNAAEWLLLDGRWVYAVPNEWLKQRPLFSNFAHWAALEEYSNMGLKNWDDVTPRIVGARIERISIDASSSRFDLHKSGVLHSLELPANPSLLPILSATEERTIDPTVSLLDGWVLTEGELFV